MALGFRVVALAVSLLDADWLTPDLAIVTTWCDLGLRG